jgi:hypothetical protein
MATPGWLVSRWPSIALLAIGSLQSVGLLLQSDAVRGLGAMTAASPLPLVFSSFRGVETFAADFSVTLTRRDGSRVTHALTPELYARLDGPYNRRNAYGAVLAYGPALTAPRERELVASVIRHGLCRGGPLARRFGELGSVERVSVLVRSKTASRERETRLEFSCFD